MVMNCHNHNTDTGIVSTSINKLNKYILKSNSLISFSTNSDSMIKNVFTHKLCCRIASALSNDLK